MRIIMAVVAVVAAGRVRSRLLFTLPFTLFTAPSRDLFGCDRHMSLAMRVGNLAGNHWATHPGVTPGFPPGFVRQHLQVHAGASA